MKGINIIIHHLILLETIKFRLEQGEVDEKSYKILGGRNQAKSNPGRRKLSLNMIRARKN